MHTVNTMSYQDFDFEVNGQKALLEDIFPGFNEYDRIGVVVREVGGGIGASALLMSALTRFYDFFRPNLGTEPGQQFIYPEFFVFHVGKKHMSHYWMDIWPPHKEVLIEEDDPEQILEAINDRGITRLLVEDINPSHPIFLRETFNAAKHRIVSALAYSPTGRVENSDVKITSCEAAEKNVVGSIRISEELSKEALDQLEERRESLKVNGRVTETYRQIGVVEALHMLTENTEPGETTRSYFALLEMEEEMEV
ncbi:hypothetical protein [Domibacillus aminovorans]|uniref:Uncharacterized protein n=1 Tax=Domibacillus aminovorans TaxID=29332 RepID=A0A177LCD4_9BACI|nr:hypothetical protein [Domibacillus aminovorans]OAH63204.1 hypothetical protein AWH49_06520 [Domibacillus aminovorans]